jgi:predicted ArsR family transcriptional regulator
MHPIIMHDLVKAHTSDLHRQAGRDTLRRDAHRARQTPAKQSTPFMPAHTTAELIRRVLTLLGARRPERYRMPAEPAQQRRPG